MMLSIWGTIYAFLRHELYMIYMLIIHVCIPVQHKVEEIAPHELLV